MATLRICFVVTETALMNTNTAKPIINAARCESVAPRISLLIKAKKMERPNISVMPVLRGGSGEVY